MNVPKYFKRGEVITADRLNEFIDYMRSLTPANSGDINVQRNTNSVTYTLRRKNTGGSSATEGYSGSLKVFTTDYNSKQLYFDSGLLIDLSGSTETLTTASSVKFGVVTASFTSGESVSVLNSNADGTLLTGSSNVYLYWDETPVDFQSNADNDTIDASLPSGSVIAFVNNNGSNYSISQPKCVVANMDWTTDQGTRLYYKWLVGGTETTTGTTPISKITYYTGNPITSWRINTSSMQVEVQTQQIYSPYVSTASAWTALMNVTSSAVTPCSGSY